MYVHHMHCVITCVPAAPRRCVLDETSTSTATLAIGLLLCPHGTLMNQSHMHAQLQLRTDGNSLQSATEQLGSSPAPLQCIRMTWADKCWSCSASASSVSPKVRSNRENSAELIFAFSRRLLARMYTPPAGLAAAITVVRACMHAVSAPFAQHTCTTSKCLIFV